MAWSTAWRVFSRIPGLPLSTRETVETDTPALAARSDIRGRVPILTSVVSLSARRYQIVAKIF